MIATLLALCATTIGTWPSLGARGGWATAEEAKNHRVESSKTPTMGLFAVRLGIGWRGVNARTRRLYVNRYGGHRGARNMGIVPSA